VALVGGLIDQRPVRHRESLAEMVDPKDRQGVGEPVKVGLKALEPTRDSQDQVAGDLVDVVALWRLVHNTSSSRREVTKSVCLQASCGRGL
jgi:hypothetical protein